MCRILSLAACGWIAWTGLALGQAQDRDTKVRSDREAFQQDGSWVYNDLEEACLVARESGKPLLVVFRCIP